MQHKYTSHIYKGSLLSTIYIFYCTIIFYIKPSSTAVTEFIAWLIIIGGAILSVYLFKKYSTEELKFGNLFQHGFKTIAVTTCFFVFYLLAMLYIIDAKAVDEKAGNAMQNAIKNNMLSEKINQAELLERFKKVYRLTQIAVQVLTLLFLGVLGSVIGAVATTHKNN